MALHLMIFRALLRLPFTQARATGAQFLFTPPASTTQSDALCSPAMGPVAVVLVLVSVTPSCWLLLPSRSVPLHQQLTMSPSLAHELKRTFCIEALPLLGSVVKATMKARMAWLLPPSSAKHQTPAVGQHCRSQATPPSHTSRLRTQMVGRISRCLPPAHCPFRWSAPRHVQKRHRDFCCRIGLREAG